MNDLQAARFGKLRPRANMFVDQAYRAMATLGAALEPPSVDPDLAVPQLLRTASVAHDYLANIRSEISRADWERIRVDGRSGEYIFEELTGIVSELVELTHEIDTNDAVER